MTRFRLARLLSIREEEAKAMKIRWAQAERDLREAVEERERRVAQVDRAYVELREPSMGSGVQATLSAYDSLDALHERVKLSDDAVAEARRRASDARNPYDLRRRDVEALRRLEERWTKEQRRARRKRETAEREDFIQRASPSTNTCGPGLNEPEIPAETIQ